MGQSIFPISQAPKTAPDWLALLDSLNDGFDGAYTAGAGTTTLPSDIYRYSSLTIGVGNTITSSGWLILLVNGVAQIDGTLTMSGKGAAGAVSNSSSAVGSGFNGITGSSGTNAGGGGGAAASGGSASNTPGGGGNINSISTYTGTSQQITAGGGAAAYNIAPIAGGTLSAKYNLSQIDYNSLNHWTSHKGAGGGSGSGYNSTTPGTTTGGAGGAGGGAIILVAKSIVGTGAIRADGLNGGNATTTSANAQAGGGGGGGGGVLFITASTISGVTLSANGGSGGNGTYSGTFGPNPQPNGAAGGNGQIYRIIR